MIVPLLLAPPTAPGPVIVPFRMAETALIVDATVNGRDASFMFDTGFGGTVLVDPSIDIGKATGSMTLRDFVRESDAPTVNLKSLRLGSKQIAVAGMSPAVSLSQGNLSAAFGQHVDGIMGFSVIKNEVTEINFQKKQMIFYPDSMDITKRIPNNKTTFLAKLLPLGGSSMELAVEVPNGNKMVLALDTGNSFYATTHRDVLERVGLWKPGAVPKYMGSSSVASGVVEKFELKIPDVKIFGVPVKNSVWDIIDLPASSADGDGTIGFGFLKNFNLTIDYARRRVWLENFTGKVNEENSAEIGIAGTYDERANSARIFDITPDSPAAEAGLKEGDLIFDINGVDTTRMTYPRLRKLCEGPVDSPVKMAISRNGILMRFEMKRRELVNEALPIN